MCKIRKAVFGGQTSAESRLGDTENIVDMTVLLLDLAPNSDKLQTGTKIHVPVTKSVLSLFDNHDKVTGSEANGKNVVPSLVDALPDSEELKPKTNKTNPKTMIDFFHKL